MLHDLAYRNWALTPAITGAFQSSKHLRAANPEGFSEYVRYLVLCPKRPPGVQIEPLAPDVAALVEAAGYDMSVSGLASLPLNATRVRICCGRLRV